VYVPSFVDGFIARQPLSQALVQTVRLLGEHKGKQDLFRQQTPQVLETLRDTAVIQSTESSNRIEGVVAPEGRVRDIVARRSTPRNRSEQEIAGYRDVLDAIHVSHADIPFTPNTILQLHRDLFQYTPSGGGNWKIGDNEISERLPDGTKFVRFAPVPAYMTPDAMLRLHERFEAMWRSGEVEPLLLIPSYVLDFLCIHPFDDGNGRMARLLTLLLLYRAGYDVGRYISLEGIVERTRDGYYDTLLESSQGWHEDRHSLVPWWEYFLGVMLLGAYRDFEERVGELSATRGAKSQLVVTTIERLPRRFRVSDVERACPVSRPTINRVLADLRRSGRIVSLGRGRDAEWEKVDGHG
jgi:Fic family protein